MQCDVGRGQVKACCKTPFLKIAAEDLAAQGPGSIFNNPYFAERRREMLTGVSHDDCAACHEHEKAGIISYRQSESPKPIFAMPDKAATAYAELRNAWPTHVELMLATTCDLRCAYCDPRFSSAWAAESRAAHADRLTRDLPELAPADDGFAATFNAWFRRALPHIEYLQFNGGEPLLQAEFYRYLDLIASEAGRLQVGLISNLNTPERQFVRFLDRLPALIEAFNIRIAVSQEAVGARAEYIRYGLVWELFEANLRRLLDHFRGRAIHLAPTMSALNLTSFDAYVGFIERLADDYDCEFVWRPSLVHSPAHLSPLLAGTNERRTLENLVGRLQRTGRWLDLAAWIEHLARAIGGCDRSIQRRQFEAWIARYDRVRKTRFEQVFPELARMTSSA
jgi:hypothetical protein